MVCGFYNLHESRARAPCAWKTLAIEPGVLYAETLAYLPLRSLTHVRPACETPCGRDQRAWRGVHAHLGSSYVACSVLFGHGMGMLA